jgi:hypothetical protein
MPFANPDHECDGWLKNAPITEDKTLLDVIKSTTYYFIVARPEKPLRVDWDTARLPPPFQYPWGTEHYWDEDRFSLLAEATKGPQFPAARSFDSDNSHLAVLTNSLAQDILWVEQAAQEIYSQFRLRVYFVAIGNEVPIEQYYVVVRLQPEFRHRFEASWTRLAGQGTLELHVWDEVDLDGEPAALWVARIVDNPGSVDALSKHLVKP